MTNASALLAAHVATLRASGYRLETVAGDARMVYAAEPDFASFRIAPGPNASNPPLWANETLTLAELSRNGETQYRRPPRSWAGPRRLTGADALGTMFEAGTYRREGTTECGERDCVVLTATASPRFEDFGAEAHVDGDGVVHRFEATYTVTGENGTTAVEFQQHLVRLGDVSVERPPWVETAVERTG